MKLNEGKPLKTSSKIIKLKPIIKGNEVMRVGGRIAKAPISADAINPMILPKKHHVRTILILYLHETNGHCGRTGAVTSKGTVLDSESQRSNQESP